MDFELLNSMISVVYGTLEAIFMFAVTIVQGLWYASRELIALVFPDSVNEVSAILIFVAIYMLYRNSGFRSIDKAYQLQEQLTKPLEKEPEYLYGYEGKIGHLTKKQKEILRKDGCSENLINCWDTNTDLGEFTAEARLKEIRERLEDPYQKAFG